MISKVAIHCERECQHFVLMIKRNLMQSYVVVRNISAEIVHEIAEVAWVRFKCNTMDKRIAGERNCCQAYIRADVEVSTPLLTKKRKEEIARLSCPDASLTIGA